MFLFPTFIHAVLFNVLILNLTLVSIQKIEHTKNVLHRLKTKVSVYFLLWRDRCCTCCVNDHYLTWLRSLLLMKVNGTFSVKVKTCELPAVMTIGQKVQESEGANLSLSWLFFYCTWRRFRLSRMIADDLMDFSSCEEFLDSVVMLFLNWFYILEGRFVEFEMQINYIKKEGYCC